MASSVQLAAADRVNLAWLAETAADIARLDARVAELDKKISPQLGRLGSTLTQEHGIAAVGAMDLLVDVGDPPGSQPRPSSPAGAGRRRWRCRQARVTRRPSITGSTWPATGR